MKPQCHTQMNWPSGLAINAGIKDSLCARCLDIHAMSASRQHLLFPYNS